MKRTAIAAALAALLLVVAGGPPSAGQEPAGADASLHAAAFAGDVAAVRRLIAAGADLDAKDPYGSTPLAIAATFGKTDVARALVDAGADPTVANPAGSTALHIAALFGRVEIVKALLAKGAPRFLRDGEGSTAFDIVAAPLAEDRELYDRLEAALGPLGLKIDRDALAKARPEIEGLLRPRPGELADVRFAPAAGADWPVAAPADVGLDPALLAELYLDAAHVEKLYGLLVVRHGKLVAEGYWHGSAREKKELLNSVTKSYTSALVGIALARGDLPGLDAKMIDSFPEFADRIEDPRKKAITVRQMLEMRAGYPWEEADPAWKKALLAGDYLPCVVDFPLTEDPGTTFQYSNVTSHFLGVVLARATGQDLASYGTEHLFAPLGVEVGDWMKDPAGYRYGHAMIRFTAREAARFGQLYLDGGERDGKRIVPAEWVEASLAKHSEKVGTAGLVDGRLARYFRDAGYGYQWWSARVGAHEFPFAWGHGGQLVVLLPELDMVIVTTADPQVVKFDAEEWRDERSVLNLVGKFVRSLPEE